MKKEHQKILKLIEEYLVKKPELRFGQAIFNLGINEFIKNTDLASNSNIIRDIHEDSDESIIHRIQERINSFNSQKKDETVKSIVKDHNQMTIEYRLVESSKLDNNEILTFENLLEKQGQVASPKGKAKRCHRICLVNVNQKTIGIGALKEVYKRPFEYAGVKELEDGYKYELGYLYVDETSNYRGLGIGKYISKLLLNSEKSENIFATTEYNVNNTMYHILKSFKFTCIGNPYLGAKTKKQLTLMVLNRKKL